MPEIHSCKYSLCGVLIFQSADMFHVFTGSGQLRCIKSQELEKFKAEQSHENQPLKQQIADLAKDRGSRREKQVSTREKQVNHKETQRQIPYLAFFVF